MNNLYTNLTIFERDNIFLGSSQNISVREIACRLNLSASTISRELRRNSKNKSYSPIIVQATYQKRKRRCGRRSIFSNLQIWDTVRHLFVDSQWSPEQISARLQHEKTEIKVSYTTIYRAIYNGVFELERLSHGNRGLIRSLRHKGRTWHSKGHQEKRGTNENTNGLIREYLPKKQAMDELPKETIHKYIEKLNLRPKKILGWKTPYEIFFDEVLHLN